jgi:hypothetical protein
VVRCGRENETIGYRGHVDGLRAISILLGSLCNPVGCQTRVGPTANDVITTDIVHLSDAGSIFLVAAIGRNLFRRP